MVFPFKAILHESIGQFGSMKILGRKARGSTPGIKQWACSGHPSRWWSGICPVSITCEAEGRATLLSCDVPATSHTTDLKSGVQKECGESGQNGDYIPGSSSSMIPDWLPCLLALGCWRHLHCQHRAGGEPFFPHTLASAQNKSQKHGIRGTSRLCVANRKRIKNRIGFDIFLSLSSLSLAS